MNAISRNIFAAVIIAIVFISVSAAGIRYFNFFKNESKPPETLKTASLENEGQNAENKDAEKTKTAEQKSDDNNFINSSIKLIAYKGQVFSVKYPEGWKITDNESGIDIIDPSDPLTGATSAAAVGWFGESSPDRFIDFMAAQVGLQKIKFL